MRCPVRPLLALAALTVVACSPVGTPENIETAAPTGAYQAAYRDVPVARRGQPVFLTAPQINASTCRAPLGGEVGKGAGSRGHPGLAGHRLSRGDVLDIRVAEDASFGGTFEVSRDGSVRLPFLDPVRGAGQPVEAVERDIASALVRAAFYAEPPRVSVRVQDLAPVSVGVTGAVFAPRPVEIGTVSGDRQDRVRQEALGASTEGRDLANALRAAGGIRPDADLSAVELRRAGARYTLDLRGVITGQDRADVMLLTGDEIFVPSRLCFQDDLMVASPISPPGVSLFLSNLTQPAAGNAPSAIGRDAREVPYGTRFLQAVIDANCVGGARATSARRSAALLSRNPMTEVSVVVERDIEDMLRRADRDDYDPYLLPGDGIACYDSAITNLTDIGRVLGVLVGIGL